MTAVLEKHEVELWKDVQPNCNTTDSVCATCTLLVKILIVRCNNTTFQHMHY